MSFGVRLATCLILAILTACSIAQPLTNGAPISHEKDELPVYPDANVIALTAEQRSVFVERFLGTEARQAATDTQFYWTPGPANKVQLYLTDHLPQANWQVETDWEHQNALILSTWKKGDQILTVLMLDDLDSNMIQGLADNYGISGLTPGVTFYATHLMREPTP